MNSVTRSPSNVRRTRPQIQRLVELYRRSGQTLKQFAQQQGVAMSTVSRWLRTQRQGKTPAWVEVQRAPRQNPSRIGQLHLSRGLVLELDRGFEPEPLAQLVQLLEQR